MNYHLSCRVRDMDAGIDAQPTERAGVTIDTGTPTAALAIWLAGASFANVAWLRCTPAEYQELTNEMLEGDHIDFEVPERKHGMNWIVSEVRRTDTTLVMRGTAFTGLKEYEFEVTIQPTQVSS